MRKFKELKEEDFYELEHVVWDRMHPQSAAFWLIATFICSLILQAVNTNAKFVMSGYLGDITFMEKILVINHWTDQLYLINSILLILHLFFVIIFSIPYIHYRFQNTLAVVTTIVALKFSLEFYLTLFYISRDSRLDELYGIIIWFILGGLFLLSASTYYVIGRVKRGELRKDGDLLFDFQINERKNPSKKKNQAIIFGSVMLGGAIARIASVPHAEWLEGISVLFFTVLIVVIQYAIMLVLPEFFLVTYCKYKFESFRVERNMREIKRQKKIREDRKKQKKTYNRQAFFAAVKHPFQILKEKSGWTKKQTPWWTWVIIWLYMNLIWFIFTAALDILVIMKNNLSFEYFLSDYDSLFIAIPILGFITLVIIQIIMAILIKIIRIFKKEKR